MIKNLKKFVSKSLLILPICFAASQTASAQYLNVVPGTAIRYNDASYGFSGMPNLGLYDNGDTHSCAWMQSGNELCTYNDGTAPIPITLVGDAATASYSALGIDLMIGGDYRTLTGVNIMASYGKGNDTQTGGWNDNRTWKSSGIAPYSGCVYLTVQRESNNLSLGFANGSSSIVKSCDYGATWTNYWNPLPSPDGNAPTPGRAMWNVGDAWKAGAAYNAGQFALDFKGHNQMATASGASGYSAPSWNDIGGATADGSVRWVDEGPAVSGFVPVTYCQDNTISCPLIDQNDQYIYLTALGAGAVNQGSYANYYLARVLKTDFPSLDVSKYQYWSGPPGGGIFFNGYWGPSMVGATPIINVTGMRSQVYYIAGLKEYILINDTAHGSFEFWTASSLTGPWVKSAVTMASQDFAEFPTINMSSVQVLNTSPATVSLRIEYGGASVADANDSLYPLDRVYSSHWQYVTLTSASTPVVQQTAASFTENLIENGLIADLAFLPELGNSITDYSGSGNNGLATQTATPYVGTNYTQHGVWFNAVNPGNDVITGSYTVNVPAQITGNTFTMFIAYRKLQGSQPNECLVSGSQISICRNQSNLDDWNITVNGATSEWFDGANIGGSYYSTTYDGSWGMFIVNYDGSTVHIYNNFSILSGASPSFPLTGSLTGSNFVLGGNGYSGEISRFVLYNSSLSVPQMISDLQDISQTLSSRGVYLARPVQSGEFLLDSQGVPKGAWSVRRLLTSYTGPAMRVYNTATGIVADLPFNSSGDLDPFSVNRVCPSGQACALDQWYDQSGNHNDLTANSVPGHTSLLSTCGANRRYCIKLDGYEAFHTPSNFFFYSFTGSINGVVQVDQANSGTYETYLALTDGVTSAAATPALWGALQGGNSNNSQMTWIRNNLFPAGPSVASNAPFVVFSWADSYNQRFMLDANYSPNYQIVGPGLFEAQARFQGYGFQMGLIGSPAGTPGTVAGYSEMTLWDTAFSGGNLRTIGQSQSAYYGTANVF